MTHHPDDPHRDHRHDEAAATGADGAAGGAPLDEDAAWREIVANYGARPEMGGGADPADDSSPVVGPPPVAGPPPAVEPPPVVEPVETNVFDRTFLDAMNTPASWEDEGHFVPPEPPPLPKLEPRRKLAWAGLFGAPLVLLLAVVFRLAFPTWLSGMLVAAFVGGFVYLVATMPRSRHDDWSGDDGAVV